MGVVDETVVVVGVVVGVVGGAVVGQVVCVVDETVVVDKVVASTLFQWSFVCTMHFALLCSHTTYTDNVLHSTVQSTDSSDNSTSSNVQTTTTNTTNNNNNIIVTPQLTLRTNSNDICRPNTSLVQTTSTNTTNTINNSNNNIILTAQPAVFPTLITELRVADIDLK